MQLALDGWQIDPVAREARRGASVEQLSPRAIRLLEVLAQADGATLSRADLLERVWPNVFVSDESLTQVVAELRRKLDNKNIIATVVRGGYRLTVPIRETGERRRDCISGTNAGLSLDAYVLCIEARDCFASAAEGVHRTFVELAAEAAARAPDYAEARALHGTALFKRHIYLSEGAKLLDVALQETAAAIALDPSLASAHLFDGAIRITLGRTASGISAVEKALSLAPEDAAIHLDAAILLLTMGNKRAAAALAAKAAQLAPDRFAAELLVARIFQYADPVRGRGFAERALKKVRSELSGNPCSMRALYALGPLLAQLGDHRAARSALEGVAHHDSPLEYYRAIGFAQIGDSSAAMERLSFLAQRGWRHACILDKDDGFRPLYQDRRMKQLQAEIIAA